MTLKSSVVAIFGVLSTLFAVWGLRGHYMEPNTCTMSWSRPVFTLLHVDSPNSKVSQKYSLYAYGDGDNTPHFRSDSDAPNLSGTPVLFLPGNAGSYEQGRSLAAESSVGLQFDWFLVDFDADLSAFHGKTLLDESAYVNDAIRYVLGLYKFHSNQPESVIIVAHSMGGVVARTLPTLDNYIPGSVNTIITLSTPHVYPPLTFDRDVTQLYDLVNQWWRYTDHGIALVSIAGGHNDLLVLPDTTIVDSFDALSLFTYELDSLRAGIDHLAIVWCGELKHHVCTALAAVCDPYEPRRTLPAHEVYNVFRKEFKAGHLPPAETHLAAPRSLLLGRTFTAHIDQPAYITLPALSSLVSYRVQASAPVQLAHYTPYEYRKYGPENVDDPLVTEETVMWYSAGPYVPFNQPSNLYIEIVPRFEGVEVSVRVAWAATLANVAMHYRTLAACWPFAVVVLATLELALRKDQPTLSGVMHTAIAQMFLPLVGVLGALHLLLGSSTARNAVRALQYPSEAANMASLRYTNYDVHDLLLGTAVPELLWIVAVLLAASCAAVLIVHYTALALVTVRARAGVRLARVRPVPGCGRRLCRPFTNRARTLLLLAGGAVGLYFVPYQVTTVGLAAYELLCLNPESAYELAFAEMLLWVAVVDAPITAVWLDNVNWEWLRAFASFRNVRAALPLFVYVFAGTPFPARSSVLLRWLTILVFAYIAFFAFVYGGLHAFMVHHLTCYLALWMLAATFDSQ